MTINNPQAFVNGLWDWSILDGCFGDTKVKPTDIDGFIERNGYFLFIESKNIGVSVPQGQRILHKRLVDTGVFTVVILWGNATTNTPTHTQIIWGGGITEIKSTNIDQFRGVVSRWFAHVNGKPVAKRIDVSFLNRKLLVLEDQKSTVKQHLEKMAEAYGGKIDWSKNNEMV